MLLIDKQLCYLDSTPDVGRHLCHNRIRHTSIVLVILNDQCRTHTKPRIESAEINDHQIPALD
jgi:hypothetical protein